jgi:hypothetical protein
MKNKTKNQFEKLAAQCPLKCDICGGVMQAMYGGGWDNDRIVKRNKKVRNQRRAFEDG